jgi:hypothetical protein
LAYNRLFDNQSEKSMLVTGVEASTAEEQTHTMDSFQLEGLTQDAAARQLRWKAAVLRGRLDRARLRLRGRLVRRGLAPAAALALAKALEPLTQAAVSPVLVEATVRTACLDLDVPAPEGSITFWDMSRRQDGGRYEVQFKASGPH